LTSTVNLSAVSSGEKQRQKEFAAACEEVAEFSLAE
jgi:hypothetical protein